MAADAELDHEAVMESKEYLRLWEQSTWPEDDFTVEANREDMVKLERRHGSGESFAYTVMNPEQTVCLGCFYVFPPDVGWFAEAEITPVGHGTWSDQDSMIYFWVRASRLDDGLDRRLLDASLDWFDREWRYEAPVVVTNEQFNQQVQMIEDAGLSRRFQIRLPGDDGAYLAYARP